MREAKTAPALRARRRRPSVFVRPDAGLLNHAAAPAPPRAAQLVRQRPGAFGRRALADLRRK